MIDWFRVCNVLMNYFITYPVLHAAVHRLDALSDQWLVILFAQLQICVIACIFDCEESNFGCELKNICISSYTM